MRSSSNFELKNFYEARKREKSVKDSLNFEYEEKILSILMNADFDLQEKIISSLNARMFDNFIHSSIFTSAANLIREGKQVNKFSLTEKLPKFADNIELLSFEDTINATHSFFIEKLQNKYFDLLAMNAKSAADIDIINEERSKYTSSFSSVVLPIHYKAFELMDYEYNNAKRITTGFKSIDCCVGTMQGGDVIILAGAPSMGKTCTMLNFVLQMAKSKYKVLLFSLEMTRIQLLNRIICSELSIEADKFRKQELNSYEKRAFKKYAEEYLPKLDIEICCDFRINAEKIRRIIKSSNADIVFIDYLGLIEGEASQNSYERIGDISRLLKLTALETNKPLFVLHQLSRKYDDREDKMPRLSDLRDSGKIEQDADMVCFVYRPAVYKPNEYEERDMRYIVGKNRHGKSNKIIELNVNLPFQKLSEKVCA